MIQPREDERLAQTPPREIVFLIDVSGSMRGEPTAKVHQAMRQFLRRCKDQDTVQVITFAGQAAKLFLGGAGARVGQVGGQGLFERALEERPQHAPQGRLPGTAAMLRRAVDELPVGPGIDVPG